MSVHRMLRRRTPSIEHDLADFGPGRLWLLAILPVAGGLGLVVFILADISLLLAFGSLVVGGSAAWALVLRTTDSQSRERLLVRARVGLLAGFVATLGYDVSRYGVVALLSWSIDPFHAWSLFGEALIGSEASKGMMFAVGTCYHLMNGIGFAIAFMLIVRRPDWWRGLLWSFGLELATVLLYPSWLRIEQQLGEFLKMSMLGHLVYGVTLGQVSRVALHRLAVRR